jgi:hypothetical protein
MLHYKCCIAKQLVSVAPFSPSVTRRLGRKHGRSPPQCCRRIRPPAVPLAGRGPRPHAVGMFVVSEAEATAIRTAFDQGGELAAAVELRRLFPGITDNAKARACVRSIAGWTPLPAQPRPVTRLRPRQDN